MYAIAVKLTTGLTATTALKSSCKSYNYDKN